MQNPARMRTFTKIACIFGVVLLWSMMIGRTSQAQEPRPTLTPLPTPPPVATPAPAAEPQASHTYIGPLLKGQVFNLNTGKPESDVTVVFTVAGVAVEVTSDEYGAYAFPHLGTANGLLNVVPLRGSGLRSVTADVAVRTRSGVETVVNLGVSSNGRDAPPLIPMVQLTPDYVSAGEVMTVSVLVKNTLPHAISDAVVTNWLPDSVVPLNIYSSTGNPYFSGNLAVAELGTLASGGGALVEIVVQSAAGGAAASVLQGRPSFFFRENAAGQAQAQGHLIGAAPTVLPATGAGLPVVGLGLILFVFLVGLVRRLMGSTLTPN
jgi:hypothetical protein